MTIEIRELIVQARVVGTDTKTTRTVPLSIGQMETLIEQRLVEKVKREILDVLREEQGGGL
ncbi:DUF5908 family protein [Photorhabdus australis]|uniref:DUF5908 family protein n=1 Tax=Photorhabdus australis TaxID=286156 RepID=UPI00055C96C3|nr:DUF5908 family protein [Photorhabdus australis]